MSKFLKQFGQNLKEYRKLCGFKSQEKFAEAVGVATNTISAVENGKSFFKMENFQKVCDVLNITPAVLFNFGSMEKNSKIKYEKIIMAKVKKLNINKQKQILDIIKTFE